MVDAAVKCVSLPGPGCTEPSRPLVHLKDAGVPAVHPGVAACRQTRNPGADDNRRFFWHRLHPLLLLPNAFNTIQHFPAAAGGRPSWSNFCRGLSETMLPGETLRLSLIHILLLYASG